MARVRQQVRSDLGLHGLSRETRLQVGLHVHSDLDLHGLSPGTRLQVGLRCQRCDAEVFEVSPSKAQIEVHLEPPARDSHIVLYTYYRVRKGSMGEFSLFMDRAINRVDPEREKLLYYGFSVNDAKSKVMCREGYMDAEGLLLHIHLLNENVKKLLHICEMEYMGVSGPAEAMHKLKQDNIIMMLRAFTQAGDYSIDTGCSHWLCGMPCNWDMEKPDTSVFCYPYFQDIDVEAFRAALPYVYAMMQPKNSKMLFHSFAIDEVKKLAIIREAYKDADGFKDHLDNTRLPRRVLRSLSTLTRVEVHATAAELEKLESIRTDLQATFYVLDTRSKTWL